LDPRGELPSPSLFLFLPLPSLCTPHSSSLRACAPGAPVRCSLASWRHGPPAPPSRASLRASLARRRGPPRLPHAAPPCLPSAARGPPAPMARLPGAPTRGPIGPLRGRLPGAPCARLSRPPAPALGSAVPRQPLACPRRGLVHSRARDRSCATFNFCFNPL
jgi:hypothetical protein